MLFAEIFGFWSWFWIIIFLVGIGQLLNIAVEGAETVAKDKRVQEGFLAALWEVLRGK